MAVGVVQQEQVQTAGATDRKDAWWLAPLLTGLGFAAFIVYSTFRALPPIWGGVYDLGMGAQSGLFLDSSAFLLSPFYSPTIILPFLPTWISPAFLILWAPGGFRLTCYFYRKAYYRAYFRDPAG